MALMAVVVAPGCVLVLDPAFPPPDGPATPEDAGLDAAPDDGVLDAPEVPADSDLDAADATDATLDVADAPDARDTATDLPIDAPADLPRDIPGDIPTDIPGDVPRDTSIDIPTDIPSDIPTDIPRDIPIDIPMDAGTDVRDAAADTRDALDVTLDTRDALDVTLDTREVFDVTPDTRDVLDVTLDTREVFDVRDATGDERPDGAVACIDNGGCLGSAYCQGLGCGTPGVCAPRPVGCVALLDPVCGCDGLDYDNACLANAVGVRVARLGRCPLDPACDEGTCGRGMACCRLLGRCLPLDTRCPCRCTGDDGCGGGLRACCSTGGCYDTRCLSCCRPVFEEIPPGCCRLDAECAAGQRCVFRECGERLGRCEPTPTAGGCWWDEDCPTSQRCVGAQVCPCGALCLLPDEPGRCGP